MGQCSGICRVLLACGLGQCSGICRVLLACGMGQCYDVCRVPTRGLLFVVGVVLGHVAVPRVHCQVAYTRLLATRSRDEWAAAVCVWFAVQW